MLTKDLLNIIVTYLKPDDYYKLNDSYQVLNITKYENLYTNDLRKNIEYKMSDQNIASYNFEADKGYKNFINERICTYEHYQLQDSEYLKNLKLVDKLFWISKLCLIDVLKLFQKLEIMDYDISDKFDLHFVSYMYRKNEYAIYIKLKLLKNFGIYDLNDITNHKYSKYDMYSIFYMNSKNKILCFDYIRESGKDVTVTDHPITLKTPLWDLLENVMRLTLMYYDPIN